jgi:hypothetical protein
VEKLAFDEEAERCRNQALAYVGRPEASLLLRVAREFELLAAAAPTLPELGGRRKS